MIVASLYPLAKRTPSYAGLDKPDVQRLYDLPAGDTCDSFYVRKSKYAGTHQDGPLHFNVDSRGAAEYDVN